MSAPANAAPAPGASPKTKTYWELVSRDYRGNRFAMAATMVIFFIIVVAVFCPLIANHRPLYFKGPIQDDYDNLLAVCQEQPRLLAGEDKDRAAVRALFASSLQQFREHAPADAQGKLDGIQAAFDKAAPASGALDAEALEAVATSLDEFFELAPVAVERYPAVRALNKFERFTIAAFFFAVIAFALRRRFRNFGVAIVAVLVPAALATGVWLAAFPEIQDNRSYRQIWEDPDFAKKGGSAVLTPVPFGENENITEEAKQAPTWALSPEAKAAAKHYHLLGTDTNGRDVLARVVYGARVSMLVGVVSVSIYTFIGIVLGACAGYFRGWVDILLSRFIEIVICFPALMVILAVQAFLPPSLINIILALSALWWTSTARLQRAEFLRLVNLDYVQAMRALGGSDARIIFLHILPNGLGPILVLTSFGIAGSILVESGLSFLGFGVPQPMASWGDLLNNGRNSIKETWWLTLFPGFIIFVTVTCFNLIGEGVRDALDPRRDR